jgi:hypothetical protein
VRGFSQDESRVGWLTVRRRRLTARGGQPIGAVQHVCEWCYVYGAVAPTTGERFCLERPSRTAESVPLCVDACAEAFADSCTILLLDNSGAHTAPRLTIPADMRLVVLPPDGPELNPIERLWRDLKDDLAWQQCRNVAAQPDEGEQLWRAEAAPTRPALTGDTYVVEAVNARLT